MPSAFQAILITLYAVLRIRDVYPRSRILDPICSIADSKVDKIPDPDPHQIILVYLTEKNYAKFSKIRSGMFIPDPRSRILSLDFFLSLIEGSKKHRIPDPGSGFATLLIQ
jgi:hypothetical protein